MITDDDKQADALIKQWAKKFDQNSHLVDIDLLEKHLKAFELNANEAEPTDIFKCNPMWMHMIMVIYEGYKSHNMGAGQWLTVGVMLGMYLSEVGAGEFLTRETGRSG